MKDKKDLTDLYISGELSGQELEDFIKSMNSDSELASDVQLEQEIYNALKDKDTIELLEKLNVIHEENKKQRSTGKVKKSADTSIFYLNWYKAAAGIALLIGISIILFYLLRPSLNERLYSEFYKVYDESFVVRSGNVTEDKFIIAAGKYSNGEYNVAWNMMKQITTDDNNNMQAFFFRGISAMETENINDALFSLKAILNDNKSLYVESAEWYLALCYLKQNDIEKAKSQFEKIALGSGYYKAEAKKILGKLKN